MTHKDIRIKLVVNGRNYEDVDFLFNREEFKSYGSPSGFFILKIL
jgi:hypothetical protein